MTAGRGFARPAASLEEGFVKAQSWWLRKEAIEMLKSGGRLTTTAAQSPPEYDLQVEHLQ